MFRLSAVLVSCFLFGAAAAQAQDYPQNTIRMIVPFAVGGAADAATRALADQMSRNLSVPVVVENYPGAGGVIGMTEIARAAPDGYTIGLASPGSTSIAVAMERDIPYDLTTGIVPIATLATYDSVLFVSPDHSAKTVIELLEYSQQNPGELFFGAAGIGSSGHLAGELLMHATGLVMETIPFAGGSEVTQALLGGHINIAVATPVGPQLSLMREGRFRALAVLSSQRNEAIPDIPAITEEFPDYTPAIFWYGIVGPAGMPQEVVEFLGAEIQKVVGSDEFSRSLNTQSLRALLGGQEELRRIIEDDVEMMKIAVAAAGLLE